MLLISYHFPPGDAVGALRWQRLAGHAADLGWELDVITVHPGSLRRPDDRRLSELPAGTRVYGVRADRLIIDSVEQAIFNVIRRLPRPQTRASNTSSGTAVSSGRPQSLSRHEILDLAWSWRRAVRTYYAYLLHLRHQKWARKAEQLARTILNERAHAAVITCGPPHQVHVTGSRLGRLASIPHAVDMRDPWSLVERLPEVVATPYFYRRAVALESAVIRNAALVVCNTELAREAYQRLYPDAATRCISVMNGYDEEPMAPPRPERRFLVAYAGSIYLDRDPSALFRAASQFARERRLEPADFAIEFMGSEETHSPGIEELARRAGLERYFRRHSARPRHEAMEFLAGAAMLVSLPQDSNMAIPSKVFEYMRYDAWLLALAEKDSATYQLLSGSGADVVAPDDVDGIARVLASRYDQYATAGRPRQPALLHRCSRAAQAEILFTTLDAVIASPRTVSPA